MDSTLKYYHSQLSPRRETGRATRRSINPTCRLRPLHQNSFKPELFPRELERRWPTMGDIFLLPRRAPSLFFVFFVFWRSDTSRSVHTPAFPRHSRPQFDGLWSVTDELRANEAPAPSCCVGSYLIDSIQRGATVMIRMVSKVRRLKPLQPPHPLISPPRLSFIRPARSILLLLRRRRHRRLSAGSIKLRHHVAAWAGRHCL